MQDFIEEQRISSRAILSRAVIVFILSVFGVLALGSDLIDVFAAYFNIKVEPGEALAIVVVLYFLVITVFLGESIGREGRVKTKADVQILIFLVFFLLLAPLMCAFMTYEVYHPLSIRYFPGHLGIERAIIGIFTWFGILAEALATTYYDFRRQISKTSYRH